MKSIKWRRGHGRGRERQRPIGARTASVERDEIKEQQADLAGLYRVSARANRSDSWVDATVTLLATIVFGLGWAVVELEGADPLQAGYDQAFQTFQTSGAVQAAWSSSAIDASMLADTTLIESTASTRSVAVVAGVGDGEMWGAERERWTDVAPRSSKQ